MKKITKRNILLIALTLFWVGAFMQNANAQFSNSWINFNNSYYKFKITKEGIYRITQAQLAANNMSTVAGSQFALYRDGQQLPVYVSTNGTFGANDYIEFYGTKANGIIDTAIYPFAYYQPDIETNILSDTAYYFLTYDATVHPRYSIINNAIPAATPAAYCWATAYPTTNNRATYDKGLNYHSSNFYSSDYDLGEGWAYFSTSNGSVNINTPQVYGSGPLSSVSFSFAEANQNTTTNTHVTLNGNSILDSVIYSNGASYGNCQLIKKTVNFNANNLSAVNTMAFSDNGTFYVMAGKIVYPHTYNFSGNFSNQAAFQIPAADRYLEISGFVTGGQAPRLYDRTNNKIYIGTETGGIVKFYLDISIAQRNVYLTNVSSISNTVSLNQVQFRNYSVAANQGNYIILSHKDYINASPSYVNQYAQYRNSADGGSYQSVVVDVTELYNQFAYGYDSHPLSVRNFIYFANNAWTTKPKFLFIVGRGVNSYTTSAFALTNPVNFPNVPTWGNPGSDNLFTSFNNSQVPDLATGRLSAWNNQEIGNYLQKIKVYEDAIKPLAVPTVEHEFWKKRGLHIAGSSDASLQIDLLNGLNACKAVIEDTLVGAVVTTIKKTSTDPIQTESNPIIDSLMNSGINFMSFYGHGSTAGFDYNLNTPDNYHSNPKFPIFGAYACEVADIFSFSSLKTISEQYIASINGGSIVMLAGDNTGFTGTLPAYMKGLYSAMAFKSYGEKFGMQYRDNISNLQPADNFMDIHTQCQLYQGDPGIATYNPAKVDFAIEESGISTLPFNVTTALDSFDLKVVLYNLGKATDDSVWVKMRHMQPGSNTVLFQDSIRVARLYNSDTVLFKIPLNDITDIGLNNYNVKIDAPNQFDELSEDNNEVNYQLYIYSESIIPVYPMEFAIMHQQDITLKASTLNAFAPLRNYKLEIDTTENFNSTLKQSTRIASIGGVIKWKPNLIYKDSMVYYWRAAPDSLVGGNYNWNYSSFIYLANGSDGWNQSHYFQYLKDAPYSTLSLLPETRKFKYDAFVNALKVSNKVISPSFDDYQNMTQSLNDVPFSGWGCGYTGSIQVAVIDSTSARLMPNTFSGGTGLYGSMACGTATRYIFEFPTNSAASREKAKLFIQSIPNGDYVLIKNLIYDGPPGAIWDQQTADKWQLDGPAGTTLYDAIKGLGFDMIDQFTSKRVFAFFRRKGDDSYPLTQQMSNGATDKIEFVRTFNSYVDSGSVTSKIVGPAKAWQSLKWKTSAVDGFPQFDSSFVDVVGIDTLNNQTLLYRGASRDTSLAFISASHYPNLKLVWHNKDTTARSAPYMDYWRVLYSPVPEAALNAAAYFVHNSDTSGEGQKSKFQIAIENLTPYPMDSMLVQYKLIDASGIKHDLDTPRRYKPLLGNDTLITTLNYDISNYHKNNFILIEANPNNDQPEQYHPNNLGNLSQFVIADQQNPLLDVTFDGIHILDKDIVSAKPFIRVLLRDENKFLPLNDSSLLKVQLMYPDQSVPVDVPMDGNICKFIPATIVNGAKNEARIEFKPTLLQDGVYQLAVSGKDRVGNLAGNTSLTYKVDFTVENTPSITNVLNYPNPFSTATQFVFTLTGSEVPSQFKIQVLSVTGKVVREIKKAELGNLHVGRNITDYRWDGKDEFGQMLGNGVYLYRVVTSIRGEDVEHRANTTVDKFFKNGYGKLYIMR